LSGLCDLIIVLIAQVLIKRSRVVVLEPSTGAITPTSTPQIITRPTFRVNIRRRGGGIVLKEVIIVMVVLWLFL